MLDAFGSGGLRLAERLSSRVVESQELPTTEQRGAPSPESYTAFCGPFCPSGVTETLTGAVRVTEPSSPTTSKLNEPTAWPRLTATVNVLLAVGLTELGENEQPMPAGFPEQERFTVPL